MHQLEAGVVSRDQVGHRNAEQFAEDAPQFGEAVLPAVIAGVGALPVAVVRSGQTQKGVGQVELVAAGLAAGEVESQLFGLQFGVFLLVALMQCREVGTA